MRRHALAGALLTAVCGAIAAQPEPQPGPATPQAQPAEAPRENPFKPFDRAAFVQHCQKLGATQEQLQLLGTETAQAATGADALLRKLNPEYDQAVAKADAGDPAAALALAKLLGATQDPYLGAHLRYRLGRVFLDGDDPERAALILDEFLTKDRNKTPLDGEALFFYGQALAGIPDRERAARAFGGFLKWFKDSAPERFLASAQQHLAEIGSSLDSPLQDIADVMKNCERRIKKTDTGEDTQKKQKQVIDELQKIIEQLEEQEKQSGGGPGGLNKPNNPASNSALPGEGPTQIGSLNRPNNTVERWGNMQDRDRKEIEAELQRSLPGPYRKMVEEYYKKLNSGK